MSEVPVTRVMSVPRVITMLLVVAGGIVLAALPLTRAAILLAAAGVLISTLIRPQISLYLLVFSVPFGSLRSVPMAGMSVTATDMLVALVAVAWLARGVIRRQVRMARAPLVLPLLLILTAQLLSLFDALSLSLAAKELIKWTEILVVYGVAASILCDEAWGDGGQDARPRDIWSRSVAAPEASADSATTSLCHSEERSDEESHAATYCHHEVGILPWHRTLAAQKLCCVMLSGARHLDFGHERCFVAENAPPWPATCQPALSSPGSRQHDTRDSEVSPPTRTANWGVWGSQNDQSAKRSSRKRGGVQTVPSRPGPLRWERGAVETLVLLMLLAGLAEAVLGIYQFLFGAGPEGFLIGRFLRAHGTFGQPNPYAGFLNLSLPLGYALLLAAISRPQADESRLHASRITYHASRITFCVLFLLITGSALLMSLSRGAWVACAVAFVVISLLHSRRTAIFSVVGVLVVAWLLVLGGANLLPSAVTQRLSSVTAYFRVFDVRGVKITDENFAVVERMAHWQAAWGMINDRPWFGYGAGNYAAAYPRYALAGWKDPLGHAHNVLLNVAAETGLVGLAAYLFFLAAALWTCWRTVRTLTPALSPVGRGGRFDATSVPLARAVALGVLGVLVAKITHEMLDNLWVHSMGVQVALLLAMVYAAGEGAARRR